MSWPLVATLMLVATARPPQAQVDFSAVMERYLEAAPMQVAYSYSVEHGELAETTQGTLFLSEPSVFRLSFFDKVYGSDGASVYLHDNNTHQTVIDSLRWNEMQLWLRLLSGDLPQGADIVGSSTAHKLTRINLRGSENQWNAELTVDEATGALSRITVTELSGLGVVIELEPPQKWTPVDGWNRLDDLPGERLDLR